MHCVTLAASCQGRFFFFPSAGAHVFVLPPYPPLVAYNDKKGGQFLWGAGAPLPNTAVIHETT